MFRLEKAITFSSTVAPICLATPEVVDSPPCPDTSMVNIMLNPQLCTLTSYEGQIKCDPDQYI